MGTLPLKSFKSFSIIQVKKKHKNSNKKNWNTNNQRKDLH